MQSLVLVAIREGTFSELEDKMAGGLEKEWERESRNADSGKTSLLNEIGRASCRERV